MSLIDARHHIQRSRPQVPQAHLLQSNGGHHLFVTDGSRLFDLDEFGARFYASALGLGDVAETQALLERSGLVGKPFIDTTILSRPPIRAISLAVAQKCNLACSYCYAKQGEFGGAAKNMSLANARRAIDLLLADAAPGMRFNLAFLGGEPLANRDVLRSATSYARSCANEKRAELNFSITTNGTLVTEDDADFFEEHGFAVTISVDGLREAHDAQRPYKSGRGSYDEVMRRVRPLLAAQRDMQVSARVTITPGNLKLAEALDVFIGMGFHSVGFSPMLSSPSATGEMQTEDLETMLGEMIACGREFERQVGAGRRYPFANMVNALREIERGTHRPYPCGAGAGYLGASADGMLASCHRFVDDEVGSMGSLSSGIDLGRQAEWLSARHVDRQEPCRSCWARYLCGGGCHHEVIHRGRPACDYVRGWLHYCLEAYLRLSCTVPDAVQTQ